MPSLATKRTLPATPSAPPADPGGDADGQATGASASASSSAGRGGCCAKRSGSGGGGAGGGGGGGRVRSADESRCCCRRCLERCVSCTATVTRLCLIIPNLIFLLFGGTLIGLGVWMRADRESSFYLEVLRTVPASPLTTFDKVPVVIIVVGSCVAILSFLGCCGACVESVCFLCIYMLLLVIVLITELVLGIVIVVMQNQILLKLEATMQHQVKHDYNATDSPRLSDNRTTFAHRFTEAWNTMQTEFKCCGAIGPEDYQDSAWYNRTKDPRLVPVSCCYQASERNARYTGLPDLDKVSADCKLQASRFFQSPISYRKKELRTALKTQGCKDSMVYLIKQNLNIIIGIVSAVAALQIADFVFACLLMRFVRKKHETWYEDADEYANDD